MKIKCPHCGEEIELSAAEIAALMGSMTSKRKAQSSAANGKKGGRPRKTPLLSSGVSDTTSTASKETNQMENQIIGKKVYALTAAQDTWLEDRWPAVDNTGTITAVYSIGETPDGATLINWQAKAGHFTYTVVDGSRGFEAVLE